MRVPIRPDPAHSGAERFERSKYALERIGGSIAGGSETLRGYSRFLYRATCTPLKTPKPLTRSGRL